MPTVSDGPFGIDLDEVRTRLLGVRERCAELGGPNVAVVGVTKSFPVDVVRIAAEAGCDAVGENYAQELVAKWEAGLPDVPVHFIGRIQSNKVRSLVGKVDLWQSVDRASVVEELSRRSEGRPPRILIQVNLTDEPHKGGVSPGGLDALRTLAEHRGLSVEGLMTVGPTDAVPASEERAFRALRRLVDIHGLAICSMGMSGDFEVAVECGSTMVRLGTALFGPRHLP